MKSLKKNQLLELKAEMPMLDNKELLSVIGGDSYWFDATGKFLFSENCSGTYVHVNEQQLALSGDINVEESGYSSGNCVVITGPGLSEELYTFMVRNTGVEWLYAFNSGYNGGFLTTSRQMHETNFNDQEIEGLDIMVHNHGQQAKPDGWTDEEWIVYNSLPSQLDVETLKRCGLSEGRIYNRLDGKWYYFHANTTDTQERYRIYRSMGETGNS